MERLVDIDALFDYFGNDAISETARSNIEYFISEKGTVEAIPKAEVKKFLEEGAKDVSNKVLAIVREDYIHKSDYENRLKADMAAMLSEIQLEIEEKAIRKQGIDSGFEYDYEFISSEEVDNIIQQKINALKGANNE